MSEDGKEFARYMWVLKFHSDWCAHLPHYTYNTTKVLGIDTQSFSSQIFHLFHKF